MHLSWRGNAYTDCLKPLHLLLCPQARALLGAAGPGLRAGHRRRPHLPLRLPPGRPLPGPPRQRGRGLRQAAVAHLCGTHHVCGGRGRGGGAGAGGGVAGQALQRGG